MGELKNIAEKSVKSIRYVGKNSPAELKFAKYYNKFKADEGINAVWKTKNNPTVKAPTLVKIIKAYPYHVLLEKESYSYDGSRNILHYSIQYASIISGFDHIRVLK